MLLLGLFVDKPVIQDCPSHFSGVEHLFTLSTLPCLADGFPAATVYWYHGGRQIDASTPLTRMHSGTYIMVANNTLGQTNMSVDITIECMYDNIYHISCALNDIISITHIPCKTAQEKKGKKDLISTKDCS